MLFLRTTLFFVLSVGTAHSYTSGWRGFGHGEEAECSSGEVLVGGIVGEVDPIEEGIGSIVVVAGGFPGEVDLLVTRDHVAESLEYR